VIVLYLAAIALISGRLSLEQLAPFHTGYLIAGACVLNVLLLSRFRIFDAYFQWYTGLLSCTALTAVLNVAPSIEDPELKLAAHAGAMYATIIVYSMSKLRFYVATFWCVLAALLHLLLVLWQGWSTSLLQVQAYLIGANIIGMGIVYLIEHRERTMFLQSLLLEIDKIEQERLYEAVQKLSREDPLTGLANRRYFEETLTQEWSRCRRDHKPLSVILLDVDHFKAFNDLYGHPAGDDCLARVGRALSLEASRTGELVGRYGGEEFILIYPGLDFEQLQVSLQRIRQRIHDLALPHAGSRVATFVTASMGGATAFPDEILKPSELISAADQMLYEAKRAGRDGYRCRLLTTSKAAVIAL
jgi:diguanylate cyclase (GGDEF)-like protein